MENVVLDTAELFALLNQLGTSQLLGVEPGQLPAPYESERDEILNRGLSQLVEKKLVNVGDNQVEVDGEIRQLFEIVSNPQAIVRTFKETASEEYWSWHYISGPSIVEFSPVGSGRFHLAKITDLEAVAKQVEDMLPLEPVPEPVQYQAAVPQEDADEISVLAEGWDTVPALSILEADGLNMAEAMDLFDDLADFQWWGRVDMMACEGGQITKARRVLVI